jgi:hypothetical protein
MRGRRQLQTPPTPRGSTWRYAFVAIVLGTAGYLSWQELRYSTSSSVAQAEILNVQAFAATSPRSSPTLHVEYRFNDLSGHPHTNIDKVPTSWDIDARTRTYPVQYLTDDPDSSRLNGHANRVAVVMFFVLSALTIGRAMWTRETKPAPDPRPRAGS